MSRVKSSRAKVFSCGNFVLLFSVIALSSAGCGKSQPSTATEGVPATPQTFASADLAGQAIYTAAKAGDTNALLLIFGSGAKELLFSGDPVQDKAALDEFASRYDQMHRWGKLTNGGLVLDVGAENYPFPFALKKNDAGQWYFDSGSAKNEILARRIGGNELSTIDVLNAMAAAQTDYFSHPHDGAKAHSYAQKFVSDEGKQNGLYWPVPEGESGSPLGPLAEFAASEGYSGASQETQPYHGYYFRMLTSQGPDAHGGAKNYIVNGSMTEGFAILAHPAEYANSGVMSFLVNQDGIVLQKDLGADTAAIAKTITSFNPDSTWEAVQ
ncbi:MAG: DUF2950 domain-containing protein [Candidatus Acidiferrales bacterium]